MARGNDVPGKPEGLTFIFGDGADDLPDRQCAPEEGVAYNNTTNMKMYTEQSKVKQQKSKEHINITMVR